VGHGCPNTRNHPPNEKTMALGKAEMAEKGSRDKRSDVIVKVFNGTTELRLKREKTLNSMRVVKRSQWSCVTKEEM